MDKLDFNYLSFLQGLGNDTKEVENILDVIRAGELEEQIVALNTIFTQLGKEKEIRAIAHRIKSVCLNVHFENLAETVSQLESLYPNYDNKEAHLLWEEVNNSYQKLINILSEKSYL